MRVYQVDGLPCRGWCTYPTSFSCICQIIWQIQEAEDSDQPKKPPITFAVLLAELHHFAGATLHQLVARCFKSACPSNRSKAEQEAEAVVRNCQF